jgi:hypothetical protein
VDPKAEVKKTVPLLGPDEPQPKSGFWHFFSEYVVWKSQLFLVVLLVLLVVMIVRAAVDQLSRR